MENALAKEEKTCPAITHPLQQLQFVHVSFDHSIAGRQCQARFHRLLVSFYAGYKPLQLADLAGPHFLQPGVEIAGIGAAGMLPDFTRLDGAIVAAGGCDGLRGRDPVGRNRGLVGPLRYRGVL